MKTPEKHLFFRIMLSYLSILIVPAAIGIVIYFSSVSSMTKLVRDYSDSMLHQSIDIIDARLGEMEALPFYLKSLPELIKLSNYDDIPLGGSGNYDIYNVYRHLPKFSLINSYIKNVQIVLLNNGFVISENNALRMTPQTYTGLFAYTGMDYESFQHFIQTQSFNNTFVQFENSSTAATTPAIITGVRNSESRYPWALVIIQLKESALQDTMKQLLLDEGSIVFVLDEEDNLITSLQGKDATISLESARSCIGTLSETEADYENYIVSTIKSDYNGWQYCIFSPREAVLSKMTDANRSVILLIALCLIMSITFTSLLCMRKTVSLKKLANYLTGNTADLNTGKKDEFSYLVNAASGLITSNRQLQQNLQSQKPLLDAAVLRNALFGAINKPEELQYLFSTLNIKPSNQKFSVILIVSSLLEDKAMPELIKYPILFSALVREYIEKNISCPTYCLDIDSRQKAAVLIGDDLPDEVFLQQLQLFVNRTYETALKEQAISMVFYTSDFYPMIDHLPKAYNQAVVISQHAAKRDGQILYTSRDIPEIQKLYSYPIQTELELIRLVKTGSQNDLEHFLDTIKTTNFTERSLSSSMTLQLTLSVRNSILRGLADLPAEQLSNEAFLAIHQSDGFDALAEALLNLNQYLVHMNDQFSSDKNKQMAEGMLQYINRNYTCSDFTIYSLCEEFHISESFAYQIFREVIGTSFADLLEQIRIEKACQLLNQKNCLIKDIALSIGYTNDNSFRRAFKRVMGVSPGDFTSH